MATCLLIPVRAVAAPQPMTARAMYTRALEQERTVRDEANKPTVADMRKVIAAYEAVVRRHPSSGYSDNALWQGGNLAMLAYQRFGDESDRKTATRLFNRLVNGYPTSKLVKEAREALAAPAPAVVSATSGPTGGPKPTPVSDSDSVTRKRSPLPVDTAKTRSDAGPAALSTLKDVQRTALPDGIRVTMELDAEIAYHQEEIANPRRLFFDLKGVKTPVNLQDATLKFDGDVVKELRLGRHPQNTTRLVVDLDGIANYTVYPLYSPYRLVVDLQRTTTARHEPATRAQEMSAPKPFVAPALTIDTKAPAAGTAVSEIKPPPAPPPPLPAVQPKQQASASASDAAPLPSKQAGPRTAPPITPAANSNGKFSLSRQLGLGVSRIVIDAGHGGHDPGAHGNGINEAELTLDVAQRLQTLLEKQPGFEVVMTRDTDEFIPLQERTAIANRDGADLFLSIHANASRNVQAHGIETYFLNFATNPEAEAVAARENAASGQAMHSLPDIVKAIALNNKINESRDFAETVQKSMVKRLNSKNHSVRDLGVKQAPFVVLIGATMPCVLAEISFLTNKQDGTQLKTQAYRQQIAQALFEAILNYQQALNRANSVNAKKATNQ
ncbi:MAG TPA: N-acetylmuramoyl-L-alanine amidase [Vicinamibacterales bacterium]|nr:N-acetylmuramoyl-L-alanine amidase [Vicinamibacterales bacterium]